MLTPTPPPAHPRVGVLATVRNRRAVLTAVEPFDGGPDGRLHLVTAEYIDPAGVPDDQLIWEREPAATLLEPTALPDPATTGPMPGDEFDALVRATRWTAVTPFVDPDAEGPLTRLPLVSPLHGAIQVEDFQLVPLLKALRMPRVSLLLTDDVGLGKTIEAGLILTELILRRPVRRVLIICLASLRTQWQQEMRDKFALAFDEVDRPATQALGRRTLSWECRLLNMSAAVGIRVAHWPLTPVEQGGVTTGMTPAGDLSRRRTQHAKHPIRGAVGSASGGR